MRTHIGMICHDGSIIVQLLSNDSHAVAGIECSDSGDRLLYLDNQLADRAMAVLRLARMAANKVNQ